MSALADMVGVALFAGVFGITGKAALGNTGAFIGFFVGVAFYYAST
jgi:hypothetical protein